VNENTDGSVSVFVNIGGDTLTPIPMTKSCCQKLDPTYTFNIDTQKCEWGSPLEDGGNCTFQPFKIVLNPKGNDGVIFSVDEKDDETCTLDISFDYLMQFDCEDVVKRIQDNTSQNTGLTEAQTKEKYALQADYDKCYKQKLSYEKNLIELENQLSRTPYVIECNNPNNEKTDTVVGFKVVESKGKYSKLSSNYNLPPRSFDLKDYSSTTIRYCLTDAGLLEWQRILGTNTYNSWIYSNGVDTSLYGCEQVNALVSLDNKSGDYLGSCDISITARDEINKNINEIKSVIKGLDCGRLLDEIESLQADISCPTVMDMLETLDVCMTLDIVNPSTGRLQTVYEESILNIGSGNLPVYLGETQPNTGFLTTGSTGTTFCDTLAKQLMDELQEVSPNSGSTQIQDLVQNSLDSEWLSFNTSITDQTILDIIYNERIKVSLFVKDCCVDFSILIDRIKLDKNCSKIKSNSTTISRSPSFDMIRVCDNKKSWLSNETLNNRELDLKFRDTQYDINNYKLAINSKEVDLDINPANAIEQDLFCYIKDNECLLECDTSGVAYECPSGFLLSGNTCYSGTTTASTIPVSGDCCCQGQLTTLVEHTDCTCDRYEKIFYDTLNGQYQPISGYSFTTNWFMDVTYNCGELIYSEEFHTGNGSTLGDIIPTPDSYAAALSAMSENLGFVFTYEDKVATITEVNNCDKTYLNNNFKIDLRLTICTCYEPYVADCDTMTSLCDTISGDTIIEYILPDWDLMDNADYKPSCELLETYDCYDEQSDEDSVYQDNRSDYINDTLTYEVCINNGYSQEYCSTQNPKWNQTDWYYSGLTQSYLEYSGYSVYNVIGPMRKIKMNWWNPISYYPEWTATTTYCGANPTYSGLSLSDIFSGVTDITTLPVVDDTQLSGITGTSGDMIQTTGVTGNEYYWSPTANQWDTFGTECYDGDLEDLLTTRRAQRDAYLKAKNQLVLALKPLLWASVYIPEFQVNKYIL
jgi:hypothetical protein